MNLVSKERSSVSHPDLDEILQVIEYVSINKTISLFGSLQLQNISFLNFCIQNNSMNDLFFGSLQLQNISFLNLCIQNYLMYDSSLFESLQLQNISFLNLCIQNCSMDDNSLFWISSITKHLQLNISFFIYRTVQWMISFLDLFNYKIYNS